ncbi:ABC-2 type transport system ATP-binding protein [Halobacillus karajensis]|uniref:ABC transporter ATP-binding protein YtrB n=1 Tax=Halobacillus karajensis TaxID=195088 RepID=A0A024P9H9_9BACI|nr:ABC transporter ATP-binding protein [Halobacillus karajensis]CDQ21446.1 ABC transporter ATP-binding protein YtrB [Halobacillus karajensis]CDQ25381.1 ABC transporter ATP-binding protein YtrB [Halobacillus karajensis]CDQ29705.1 ABC transporter ATP-binding protein YtrB [Halobacillus karajensis]SEI07715.1 ABC-2 type transport system ATP-binding protein [Halobacillus karajensis]
MIEVQSLYKSFGKEAILKDVSFHVQKGSIYGLLGSNGAGKTTLMRIIAGILKQKNGHVRVLEEEVFDNERIKQKVVFLPDSLYFLPQYTTRQMADYYSKMYDSWDEERYQKLKRLFQLDEKRKISQFSKGMQRQVAFWLAMSSMPDVLILDEPFDGLDAVMRQKVRNVMIQDVAEREMTVLISSHNLREVEDVCDHVGILHQGEILLERDLDDLKADVHKIQVAFQEEAFHPEASGLDILHQEKRGSVFLLIVRGNEGDISAEMKKHRPLVYDRLPLTLEEIFIYEMGGVGYAFENIIV